jgi:hypothetical protein
MCPPQRPRPSARAFFTNLSGPQPWLEKVSLLLKNNWLKIKNFQDCCGHPGEPGC